ncbi:polysaccharide export protein [Alphaproteobacteria bacterium GH1-50]|uniref:Polysaccharide export protein n=1 Tax=Kangsaoukella pontilimi TaxID=2691042 RepID=A0A7C9MXZ4_9RHOB|nr:polysaccharide biosynthesis/export family protein [Kangsaoukella pontilimi]MXQ06418.1 polysaccharide export protein [Kangsaoukella pontilimi]
MKTIVLAIVAMLFATTAFAQGNYAIRSGDRLAVEVLEDPSLNRSVLVLPDGTINFPFAGTIRAGGQTAAQVANAITSGIASNFNSAPNVFVTVTSLRPREPVIPGSGPTGPTVDVFMMGEIGAPGAKALPRGTTLIQALATTGGFTRFAATKRIILRRTDPATGRQTVSRINYKAIADGTAVGQDIILADGDVIIVPERRLFE